MSIRHSPTAMNSNIKKTSVNANVGKPYALFKYIFFNCGKVYIN